MKEITPCLLSYIRKIISCKKCNRSFEIGEEDTIYTVKHEVTRGRGQPNNIFYTLNFKLPCCGDWFDVKDIK